MIEEGSRKKGSKEKSRSIGKDNIVGKKNQDANDSNRFDEVRESNHK